jgi:hypothetical protein
MEFTTWPGNTIAQSVAADERNDCHSRGQGRMPAFARYVYKPFRKFNAVQKPRFAIRMDSR